MNFPGFILSPAGFAMPGGESLFCPDLRIVPLRHRKRPAPRPPAVSAEKQAQHRPLPHRPHFPPPGRSSAGSVRALPRHVTLFPRRSPLSTEPVRPACFSFARRAQRSARYRRSRTPTSGIARRLFPRFPHMPAETGSGILKPEGTENSLPEERKRPGHPPTARDGTTFRNRQARFGRIRPRVERFPFVRDFFVSLTSS